MNVSITQICVPTDFSDCSEAAIKYGLALAKLHGARLHLVHVIHDVHEKFQHPDFTQENTTVHEYLKALEHGASQNLARLAAERVGREIPTERVYLYGNVADAVVRYAQKNAIEMLIVGHHGRSGVHRPTLGTTAQAIIRDAPCPVLVIAHPQDRGFVMGDGKLPGVE